MTTLREEQLERTLRCIRQRIFSYDGTVKEQKASKLIDLIKYRLSPTWEARNAQHRHEAVNRALGYLNQ